MSIAPPAPYFAICIFDKPGTTTLQQTQNTEGLNLCALLSQKYSYKLWEKFVVNCKSGICSGTVHDIDTNVQTKIEIPHEFCGNDMGQDYIFSSINNPKHYVMIAYNNFKDIHSILTFFST